MSIWVVLIVAVIFTPALGTMFYFGRDTVQKEALQKGRETLENTALYIDNTMSQVEIAADNMKWHVEQNLQHPEKMFSLSRQLLSSNPYLTGCSIAFEPYYYSSKGKYFSAYSYNGRDSIQTEQEGNDNYQYHCMDWYLIPKLLDKPYWVEPFQEFNTDGIAVKEIMTSYCQPIYDGSGQSVGVLSVDLSLDWFSRTILSTKPFPNSYCVLLGRGGTFIVHPDSTRLFYETILTPTLETPDSALTALGEAMLAGKSGYKQIHYEGTDCYVFYMPFKKTEWSVAIICPESDIFGPYQRLMFYVRMITIVGLLLLLLFSWYIIRRKLQPLHLLACSTEHLSQGHFDTPIPKSERLDELGQLQNSFVNMQDSLAASIQQIRQSTNMLRQRNVELLQAYEHARKAESVKATFVNNMTDQMNQPVHEVASITDDIREHFMTLKPEETQQKVKQMMKSTDVILKLLDELIKVAENEQPIKSNEEPNS
jgi:sigma-B regulation protein RsbU (phosphoserine phosphatase)